MLTCIAVDDEPLALKLLEDNISKVPFLEWKASCRNAFEAMKVLQQTRIDLIFIDIQMPGLTGLQYIGSLKTKPLVIFVTAYKQYALESYDLDVVDYVVKPVSIERFIKACNRAKELHELKVTKHLPAVGHPVDYFFLNADYSQVKIMFEDIIWMEGLRDYIKIHLKSSKNPLLFRTSLKVVEPELPAFKFIRIHKSYIVAIHNITSVRKNSLSIHDLELPIGETFREAVAKLVRRS
ncbi:response regulator transcription factor [Segetibacter sp. 3557_3]|uniref:LytR/AlgR family response regulator transcription factor n=1 Tax=Segetibacter sp. 3557_3 TaxID=2547429 RepID=UPI0010589FD5|nr:LytTR family DNA-binding domain-containing protein [Segetibacter sp. 3557_3]TDH18478.1 response regulator transcription factor [Segetibacter sp. 3557_3]